MKFTTQITLFTLALGVTARLQPPSRVARSPPSLVERDIATVTSVLSTVDSGIKSLNSAVGSFSGDDSQVDSAASDLISTIKAGTSTVSGSGDLSLTDALGLTTPVQAMQGDAETLVKSLSAKKSAFEDAGLCSKMRQQTTDIASASKALIDAIVSKVPEAAQGIAQNLAAGITKSLNEAQSEFAEGSCVDKAAPTSAAPTSAAPTSAAPTSAPGGGETSAPGSTATGAPTGGETSAPGGSETSAPGGSACGPSTGGSAPTETGVPSSGGSYPTGTVPSGGAGATGYPTGGYTSSQPAPPVVTAGAAAVAAGPVGAVFVAVAAALL